MASWKEMREATRASWIVAINKATSDTMIQRLAIKGAVRTLDERFSAAESKAEIVAGKVKIPTLASIAESSSVPTLREQASELMADVIMIDNKARQKALFALLINPTKVSIEKAKGLLAKESK